MFLFQNWWLEIVLNWWLEVLPTVEIHYKSNLIISHWKPFVIDGWKFLTRVQIQYKFIELTSCNLPSVGRQNHECATLNQKKYIEIHYLMRWTALQINLISLMFLMVFLRKCIFIPGDLRQFVAHNFFEALGCWAHHVMPKRNCCYRQT